MNELFIKRGILFATKHERTPATHRCVFSPRAACVVFGIQKNALSSQDSAKGRTRSFFAGSGIFITGAGVRRFPGPVRRLYTGGFPDFAAFVGDPGERGCRVSLRGVSPFGDGDHTVCGTENTTRAEPVGLPAPVGVWVRPSPRCKRPGTGLLQNRKARDLSGYEHKIRRFCKTGRSCGQSVRVCKDPESGALRKSGCPAGSQTSSAVYMKIGSGNQSFAKSGSRSRSGE